jgi:hypothetical protein
LELFAEFSDAAAHFVTVSGTASSPGLHLRSVNKMLQVVRPESVEQRLYALEQLLSFLPSFHTAKLLPLSDIIKVLFHFCVCYYFDTSICLRYCTQTGNLFVP